MRLTIEVHSRKRTYLQFMVSDRSLSSMLLKSKRSKKIMQFVKFNFFMLRSFRLPSYKINFVGSSSFEKIPGTELCLFDIFQIAEPSDGLKMRGGGGPYLWGEHNVHLHTLVEIGLTVTENPREIARERLLRRLPTTVRAPL